MYGCRAVATGQHDSKNHISGMDLSVATLPDDGATLVASPPTRVLHGVSIIDNHLAPLSFGSLSGLASHGMGPPPARLVGRGVAFCASL
eukprot:3058550-Prymnesium_polylepis.1